MNEILLQQLEKCATLVQSKPIHNQANKAGTGHELNVSKKFWEICHIPTVEEFEHDWYNLNNVLIRQKKFTNKITQKGRNDLFLKSQLMGNITIECKTQDTNGSVEDKLFKLCHSIHTFKTPKVMFVFGGEKSTMLIKRMYQNLNDGINYNPTNKDIMIFSMMDLEKWLCGNIDLLKVS